MNQQQLLQHCTNRAVDPATGTPARDLFRHVIALCRAIGPNNYGLVVAYLREHKQALDELMAAIEKSEEESPS